MFLARKAQQCLHFVHQPLHFLTIFFTEVPPRVSSPAASLSGDKVNQHAIG